MHCRCTSYAVRKCLSVVRYLSVFISWDLTVRLWLATYPLPDSSIFAGRFSLFYIIRPEDRWLSYSLLPVATLFCHFRLFLNWNWSTLPAVHNSEKFFFAVPEVRSVVKNGQELWGHAVDIFDLWLGRNIHGKCEKIECWKCKNLKCSKFIQLLITCKHYQWTILRHITMLTKS